jgi:hypothetical protein
MKKMSQFGKTIFVISILASTILSFQNCSKSSFQSAEAASNSQLVPIIDAECLVPTGCNSAAVEPEGDLGTDPEVTSQASPTTQTQVQTQVQTQTQVSAQTQVQVQSQPQVPRLYNFVAGSKDTCENSIYERLGIRETCRVGGGCGLSCGMPSASCASANPINYGACIFVN